MYRFEVRLGSFGELPEAVEAALVARFVESLAFVDLLYLRSNPETLPLYASGVRYECGVGCGDFSDLPAVYSVGRAACAPLTAIRLAELWNRGEPANALVAPQVYDGGVEFHVTVQRADGSEEDPSAILGM